MKTDFLCPHCRGYLSVGNKVIFSIRKSGWSGGLLLLSPELGEYSYEHHASYQVKPGEEFDFLCPICHADLSVPGSEKLAKVLMHEKEGGEHEFFVVFSRVEGEKCTFKISEKKLETYGDASSKYFDFLNASLMK